MNTIMPYNLKESSEYIGVPTKWLRDRIDEGTLPAKKESGKYIINQTDLNKLKTLPLYREYLTRQLKRQYHRPYIPSDLKSYHSFHKTINEYSWLIKAYFTPKDLLKQKRFRIDLLLQSYIRDVVAIEKDIVKNLVPEGYSRKDLIKKSREGLNKIWYNELAYISPNIKDPYIVGHQGIQTNIDICATRFAFPSWKITQAYYAIYHSYRTLCDVTGISYRVEQHAAPLRAFKAMKLLPALRTFLGFPFSLRYGLNTRNKRHSIFLPEQKSYLKYKYASHPRPPHYCFDETLKNVISKFRQGWSKWSEKRRNNDIYMLPDYLHDFRNWVNYVDIGNMVALKSEGFRA